ncbi:MAG: hypothetical protein U0793_14295 [Gemmataceae bacterium]
MKRALTLALFLVPSLAHADAFDNYTNQILAKIPESKNARLIKELTPEVMVENSRAVPGLKATMIVVRTNDGRFAKLAVQPARQKVSADESVPILLIERFVTYREGEEKKVHVEGQNVRLFEGFRFSLDLGQVVPESLGGDVRFVVAGDKAYAEPVGKAELYVVTKNLPETTPKKSEKFVAGAKFEPRLFNGTFKLYDDGRRTGTLKLTVGASGEVSGALYSDKDGAKYEVAGKIGMPNHMIEFNVTFPRTIQTFQGWMFTGDARVITGSARMLERETGFYAVRVD